MLPYQVHLQYTDYDTAPKDTIPKLRKIAPFYDTRTEQIATAWRAKMLSERALYHQGEAAWDAARANSYSPSCDGDGDGICYED